MIASFVRDFWRSARRPAVLRRCLLIAFVVGTLLTLVNQLDALATGVTGATLARIAVNFVIPFVVSNLGAMPDRARTP